MKRKCEKKGLLKRGEITRIAAELGVTKGHVSRCLRGERFSGRVERASKRRIA